VLLIFLPNDYIFFQTGFLSIKSTFKPLKRNPKHTFNCRMVGLKGGSWTRVETVG
jgi:hypothetical protein